MTTLATNKLVKAFDGFRAVDGVSVSVKPGKITALIGPNGSGKSTTINLMTGLVPFDEGTIVVGEHTVLDAIKPHEIATYGMTRTFQHVRVFEQMTVLDNVLVVLTERNPFRSLFEKHGRYHLDLAKTILERVDLWKKKDDLAVNLSYGQRKLLEIARVVAMGERTDGESKILFFDEPYAGLFPEMKKLASKIILELRDEGKAIVLVTHNMDIIREISDFVYVLDAGKHLAKGSSDEVLSDPEVVEAYLGD